MAKQFNRAILIGGEKRTVGTPVVNILQFDSSNNVLFATGATVPTDADAGYAKGCIFIHTDGGVGTTLYQNEGSATSADFNAVASAAAGGVNTFDELYDNDKTMALDDGVLTFTVSTAANGLYLNKTNAGAGVPLVIANSGSGYDIQGPAFSIISTGSVGILELASGGTINATDGALTIGKTATATTFAGTVTVAEGLTTSDGAVTFTDNSNAAASVSVVNATATTYAGIMKVTGGAMTTGTGILATFASMTEGIGLSIVAADTTTGSLLKLTATEATLTTGKYIQCYDGAADDFSVARYGAVTIGGLAANNMLTITTGDVLLSDSSITVVDADNAASLSVTNNTATTASVFVFAGSGVFTGSTTSSFMTVTPSGLTTGTAIYAPLAAMTTGVGYHSLANALTTGKIISISSSATAITGAGRLFLSTHSGATGTTATLNEFISAATDESIILQVKASAALALGKILNVSGASVTTGSAIVASDLNALTTGIGVHIASSATAITGAGRLFYSNHTGATGTSATLNEFASAATDETIITQITASGALALGTALGITADSCTTGFGINMSMDALTTGTMVNLHSDSADTTARSLVHVHNDNSAAVGVTPIEIVQDAIPTTHFKIVMKLAGVTLWISDGTTANGALSGTAGDICFNAGSNKPEYCSGTTTWTALV
jgi:hypothetical protein